MQGVRCLLSSALVATLSFGQTWWPIHVHKGIGLPVELEPDATEQVGVEIVGGTHSYTLSTQSLPLKTVLNFTIPMPLRWYSSNCFINPAMESCTLDSRKASTSGVTLLTSMA